MFADALDQGDPNKDDLIGLLAARFEPLPSEKAVISALFYLTGEDWLLTHASVLVGPPAMGQRSWSDWARSELASEVGLAAPGVEAKFCRRQGEFLAVRQSTTLKRAGDWVRSAYETGEAPALGSLPVALASLNPPRAPALARPGNDTPASGFVLNTVRPCIGFRFQGDLYAESECPHYWDFGPGRLRIEELLGIDVPVREEQHADPAPPGVFYGRISRRAWIPRVFYKQEEELLHVWLRFERHRIEPQDLEVELREYADQDLADVRRVRLADIPLSSKVKGRLGLKLPTLGRNLSRTAALYHRDGELLDQQVNFSFVEGVDISVRVDGGPSSQIRVGEKRPAPNMFERVTDLERVESSYRWWFARGAKKRLISGVDAKPWLKSRLARAKGELLVIDPYFGKDSMDWELLRTTRVPVRVLTGRDAKPPPAAISDIKARRWMKMPIPFHDRFYLWHGGGLNVGASPAGFAGKRMFRIDELSKAEVGALEIRFEAWWRDRSTKPL